MSTFHDDKVWQAAYLGSLDTLEVAAGNTSELFVHIKNHALTILTVTADALSRKDNRAREEKFANVQGLIWALRSLLSVAWAQEVLTDEQFKSLDETYEQMAADVPSGSAGRRPEGHEGRRHRPRRR